MDSVTIGILIGVGGILIGIAIPLIVYFLQKRQAWIIAKKAGSFDKPIAHFSFLNQNLSSHGIYNLVYGIDFKSLDSSHILFEFPFKIGNLGNINLKNILINIPIAPKSDISIPDEFLKINDPFPYQNVKRKFSNIKDHKMLSFSIENINPHNFIEIREILMLSNTSIDMKVPVTFKDNVSGIISVNYKISYVFDIVFSAENYESQIYHFKIQVINSKNIEELVEIIKKDSNEKLKENISEDGKSFFVSPSIENGILAVFPSIELLYKQKEEKVYLAKIDFAKYAKLDLNISAPKSCK